MSYLDQPRRPRDDRDNTRNVRPAVGWHSNESKAPCPPLTVRVLKNNYPWNLSPLSLS